MRSALVFLFQRSFNTVSLYQKRYIISKALQLVIKENKNSRSLPSNLFICLAAKKSQFTSKEKRKQSQLLPSADTLILRPFVYSSLSPLEICSHPVGRVQQSKAEDQCCSNSSEWHWSFLAVDLPKELVTGCTTMHKGVCYNRCCMTHGIPHCILKEQNQSVSLVSKRYILGCWTCLPVH